MAFKISKSGFGPRKALKMCILFLYSSTKDNDGDYKLILASNRDEYYDRPSLQMAPWNEDSNVLGGRDLRAGGAWLAVSPLRKRLGVLLNLPGKSKVDAKSRGKLVESFVQSEESMENYIASMNSYIEDCNGFVFATALFGTSSPSVKVYCNVKPDNLISYDDECVGVGNSLPEKPLTKVIVGKEKFRGICSRLNKINTKKQLVEELIALLKSEERHLPDPQLEERQPNLYKQFSSIFVHIPEVRYGTRTHTLVLVTKSNHVEIIELNLVAPIEPMNPKWEVSQFEFDL